MRRCVGYGETSADASITAKTFERRALNEDDVAIVIAYCGGVRRARTKRTSTGTTPTTPWYRGTRLSATAIRWDR